jgi:hypothetical protein
MTTTADKTPDKPLSLSDIEELLEPMTVQILKDLQQFLDARIAPVAERLQALEDVATAPEAKDPQEPDTGKDPVALRLQELEAKLAAKEQLEADQKFADAVRSAIKPHGTQYADEALEYLLPKVKEGAKQDSKGQWLTKDGKSLEEASKAFFDSPFGKHLLPPTHQEGSGTQAPGKPPVTPDVITPADYAAAFL